MIDSKNLGNRLRDKSVMIVCDRLIDACGMCGDVVLKMDLAKL